jgi:hypothetical protein
MLSLKTTLHKLELLLLKGQESNKRTLLIGYVLDAVTVRSTVKSLRMESNKGDYTTELNSSMWNLSSIKPSLGL